MIAARIDFHVSGRRHVALDAKRPPRARLVMMMGGSVVLGRRVRMARRAKLISLTLDLRGVRVVAIGAADALVVHFALQERAVLVDLVKNLAVAMIGRGLQRLVGKAVVKAFAGMVVA